MPVNEQDDPFGLVESLFQDWFRDSLDGKPPPAGYRLWGYKLVRSDRCAGGDLRWPEQDNVLVETQLSDGYGDGVTPAGMLAIVRNAADVALTSHVGGSVLLTLAFNPEDIVDTRDNGVMLVRRAYVADADIIAQNLNRGILGDYRYQPLHAVDVLGQQDKERASFLGPEPLQPPGLDVRLRTRSRPGSGDRLAAAIAVYRQPPNDPFDVALALIQVAIDEESGRRLAAVHKNASILQSALPWERQVAVQRRIDGYLLEHFGRVDPRSDDPDRPMGRAEQCLHAFTWGIQFLNLAETLIEWDIDYDDLADGDSLAFVQRLLPPYRELSRQVAPPVLSPGPAYQIRPWLSDGVPRWPELDAVYLPAGGEPVLVRLEANGPCSARERHCLLGGPVTHMDLDATTRMLIRADAPGEASVNAIAAALLSRYSNAASPSPVKGGVLLTGVRSDGAEEDAPEAAVQHLAALGHPVPQQYFR